MNEACYKKQRQAGRNIMNKYLKIIVVALAVVIVGTGIAIPVLSQADEAAVETQEKTTDKAAEEAASDSMAYDAQIAAEAQTKNSKALAAAIVVGIAAAAGAVGMAFAISKSVDGAARQPEASGKIQTMLMLGLVFIETAIIYALIVAILIIFVL